MRIIDTNKANSPQFTVHSYNEKPLATGCRLLTVFFLGLSMILTGCAEQSPMRKAQSYIKQSQDYYQRAIGQYRSLISQGKNLDAAYFELGLLYYRQGEYELANDSLSKISSPKAAKYRALSLYKINDFTVARDIFKKIDSADDETLYFLAQSCERLNLYDEALKIYQEIDQQPFKNYAKRQVQLITRKGEEFLLENLSSDLQKIISTPHSVAEYPNAGALILLCDEEAEITSENTAVYSEHSLVKILNKRGKKGFSEIVIGYDSTDEKVELEYARTIRPDGVIIPVGKRHIRDVSKYLNFPLYSNARARIISFPEVSEGCVIEYKYKVYQSELINKKDFVFSYRLQESEPVIQSKFKLRIPQSRSLQYKIINPQYNKFKAQLDPIISQKAGYREYSWEFRDIPAIIPEADMPSSAKINSIILISSFGSWQSVYDWWWGLSRDKMQPDAAIKKKVAELTQDKQTLLDKVSAIYNFCAEDIRYVAVAYGQAGHEPHKAVDIFSNKYGDCKDQTILLATMLEVIGVDCFPVLIGTDDYLDLEEDFPSLSFNHCIAAVKLEGQLIFLDPTCSTCSFGNLPVSDQDRKVLIFTKQGFKIQTIPLFPASHNRVKKILKLQVSPDETIEAEKTIYTHGFYDTGQRFWLRYSSDDAISQSLKQIIQGVSPASRLTQYNIQNLDDLNKQVILNYSFSGQEYWTKAGTLRIFPQLAALNTTSAAKQTRRYPLDLGSPDTNAKEVDVILPKGFKLKYLPDSFSQQSPWLDLNVEYRFKNNRLYFRQELQRHLRYISLEEYPEFKSFIDELSARLRERIILESTE